MKKRFKNFLEIIFNASEVIYAVFIPLGILLLIIHTVMDVLKDLCV